MTGKRIVPNVNWNCTRVAIKKTSLSNRIRLVKVRRRKIASNNNIVVGPGNAWTLSPVLLSFTMVFPFVFAVHRRKPYTRDGRPEIHSTPGHRHFEIDPTFIIFRTAEYFVQYVRRLRNWYHSRGARLDRPDNVGIHRPRNISLWPEPVSERRGMPRTRVRRFPVPLLRRVRWRGLFHPGGNQR